MNPLAMTISIDTTRPSLEQLPPTFAIYLANFAAISLTGEEKSKYLQGQVTCNVNTATPNSLTHGAHCDAKGKVFSIFRLISRDNAHLLLQPQDSIEKSLFELKKFGVFAKVTIEPVTELGYLAIVGDQASEMLLQHFQQVPDSLTPVLQLGSTTLLYIAGQTKRFLLIDDKNKIDGFAQLFNLTTYSHQVWELLEINEGFPLLAGPSIAEYVPQMLNLQAIHGICFTKGCYLGQETVARMQYLGKNKRALFNLLGSASAPITIGEIVEKQLGENWRKAGDVLASYLADDHKLYVQAILANDLEANTHLRLKDQQSALENIKLPYSLT